MRFLGYKLKNLREVKGLSLLDLEKTTGIGNGHLSAIEREEKNPRPQTVKKICDALKMDEQYFYIEDSRLPTDLLPDMPEEVQKFIMQGENTPWLVLTEKAKREGVSREMLEKMLDLLTELARKAPSFNYGDIRGIII